MIYSDVLQKYENYLIEKDLIIIDAQIQNENNQVLKIIANRINSLNDFIAGHNCNVTLFTNSDEYLQKLVPLLDFLEFGKSNIFISKSIEQQQDEIKIKENIKLSSKLIDDIFKVNGIDNIAFS